MLNGRMCSSPEIGMLGCCEVPAAGKNSPAKRLDFGRRSLSKRLLANGF